MRVTICQTELCPHCHELDAFLKAERKTLPPFDYDAFDMGDPAQLVEARLNHGIFIKECPALLINNMLLTANVLFKDGKMQTGYVREMLEAVEAECLNKR